MRFRGFRAAAALALLVLLLFVAHATGDVGSEAPGRAQCRAPPLRPRLVLGADGRQRIVNMAAPPYNSVVQLSMGTIGGNTSCSGVLITRELVLTAASCIFLPRDLARGIAKPSWVSSVRAGLGGFRGDRTAAGIGVSSLHVPTRYLSAASTVGYSREASESDFAVLRLLRAVDASILIPGRLGMAAYNGGGTVLGFPSNKAGLWSARCQLGITGTRASEWIACDMSSGQEGGPVLRDRLPTVAGSTPASLIGIVVRTPDGSSLNRIAVLNKDAETFIRNVISLPSDPCLLRGRTCSRNALCTTNSTRATCTCLPGLFGDGYSCSTDVCLARGLKCSVNGYCWDTGDIPRCRCNSGFIGDGVTCVLPTTSKTATASSTATRTRTTRTRSATRTRRLTTSRSHTTDESPREPTFTINVIPPSSTTATRTSYTETTTQTSNTRTTSSITTSTPNPCDNPDAVANLGADSELPLSDALTSSNRQYCLSLRGDANLVLSTSAGTVLFSSGTEGSLASSLYLRTDGNLMLKASTGAVIWQTRKWNTTGAPYTLFLGDDGKLQVMGRRNYVLWSHSDGGFLTPSSLPSALQANLALWLDGGNPNSMPDGYPMRWLDTSGNSRHLAQPDASYVPLQLSGGFDFSNGGYLSGPAPLPAKAMNFTMAVVFNAYSTSSYQSLVSQGRQDFGVFAQGASFFLNRQNLAFDLNSGTMIYGTQSVTAGTVGFGVVTVTAGKGGSTGSVNGASTETNQYPDDRLQINNTCFVLGRGCPARLNAVLYNGAIHEVMIFPTSLSDSLRRWIDGYFAWKWGVVDNLPAAHMYAATPPASGPTPTPGPAPATQSTLFSSTSSTTRTTFLPTSCGIPDLVASLNANSTLGVNNVLASPNHQYCLTLQDDSNLILSNAAGSVLFASGTALSSASSLYLRWDGNLMLRAPTGAVIWQTRKWNSSAMPYALVIGDDGSLQVVGKNGYVLWSRSDGSYKTPMSLPSVLRNNLALWLDGGNRDSMPGGTPTRWLDVSGNSRHLSQWDPSYAPQRLPGGFSFANGGYFTGSAPLPANSMDFTMAVVFNASTVSNVQALLSEGRGDFGATGTAANFYLVRQNLVFDFMYASQTFSTTNVSTAKLNFGVIVSSAGSGKNSIGSLNGGAGEVGNFPDGTLKINDTCFAVGRSCPTRINGNQFTGVIHEVMIFSTNLPDNLRYWIDGYFAWKWGAVEQLPASHFYSVVPPS